MITENEAKAALALDKEIKEFERRDISIFFNSWDVYALIPYTQAYKIAFETFKKTFKKQEDFEKIKMELLFTGLSICGGSIFAAAFGALTARQVAGRFTIDIITSSNLNKTLSAASIKGANKTAEFIIGESWIKGGDFIGKELRESFAENPSNFKTVNSMDDSFDIYLALQLFLKTCRLHLEKSTKALDSIKDVSEKKRLFQMIKNSPMCKPPSKSYFPETGHFAELIELSFYMKFILNTDHLVTREYIYVGVGTRPIHHLGQKTENIDITPENKNYPKGFSSGYTKNYSTVSKTVVYDDVGQDIINRINKLYESIYKKGKENRFIDSTWFGEYTDKAILYKASRVLTDIANRNYNIITQQVRIYAN